MEQEANNLNLTFTTTKKRQVIRTESGKAYQYTALTNDQNEFVYGLVDADLVQGLIAEKNESFSPVSHEFAQSTNKEIGLPDLSSVRHLLLDRHKEEVPVFTLIN